ncbi:zinc finger protein 687b-like [Conger conger]|uniref:zinc finger protein 687b-like n=1 Tax=Conger conger TaxID=82655 RepID=UPI002A5A9138|nr:zinc finger protein 687b-like [Conger conger]
MGDMKTPDFDDLLAAFDIPDIDAKEAIQSAPEEAEGHHGGAAGGVGKSGSSGTGSGGPSLRPTSPPDHQHHPQTLALSSQGDPPVVSVIVKNRVRPDVFGEPGVDLDKEGQGSSAEVGPGNGVAGAAMGTRPRIPGMVPSEPLVHNGFEATAASSDPALRQAQTQSNGEIWPPCSPKTASEGGGNGLGVESASIGKHGTNIFSRLKPLMGPGDPVGKARKMLHLQQQQHEAGLEGLDPSKTLGTSDSASSHAAVSAGIPSAFFPAPLPVLATPSSSHPISPCLSQSSLNVVASHPSGTVSSPMVPTSQPFNGQGVVFRHLESDDEDSDPDFGSPLVIQESPDSPACTPPKFPRRHHSPPRIFNSHPAPPTSAYTKTGDVAPAPSSPSASTCPQASQSWLPSPHTRSPAHGDRSLEHVIEERDSPESPEPEAPRSAVSPGLVSSSLKRSLSPAVASSPLPTTLQGSVERGMEGVKEAGEALGSKAASKLNPERELEQVSGTEDEKMDVDDGENIGRGAATRGKPSSAVTVPTTVTSTTTATAASSRPLKVRIKTVKSSTGGITRTVTRVAAKGAGSAVSKDTSKAQSAGPKGANRPKKTITPSSTGQAVGSQQHFTKGSILPVSTIQDASTAMLMAASKAQNKMATSSSEKSKVSTTAVNITRSAALPSISSSSSTAAASPKFSPGTSGVGVRTVGQKTVNGATVTVPVSQASKPVSIVNSTGAVISRTQSTLVEAFNKILNSKNLLPSYRPDLSTPLPPEWSLPLPANGYRCLECGDAFALERSLARHYDRRSLRIEVTCNHCAKRLAFFNKCSLLLHAREHKERGLVMQCSHLVMRPVSIEQMIGQQDTTPIGMLSPSLSSPATAPAATAVAPAAPSLSKEDQATQPSSARRALDSPQVLLPLPCKKGEMLQYHNFKCPECRTQFGGKTELVAHFQEVKAASTTTCMLCSPAMMLPNSCSAAAHQRIHKHRSPHVCPECGGIARPASFQTHLDEACLHFSRRIGYRCSSCQVVFGGLNSIKSHIQTAHCEVFHKCPSCPMAFKSAPSAHSHISTQHPALGTPQAKMIYKCVMCDTVFTQKPLLYVHFDTHLAKQKVHVFKCPDCTKLYAQKGSMMEHIKVAHRGQSKQEVPDGVSSPASQAPPSSLPKSKSSVKTESSDGEEWSGEQEEEEEEGEHAEGKKDTDVSSGGAEAGPGEWREGARHAAQRGATVPPT